MKNYLTNRNYISGVPQGSMLFNVFVNEFLFNTTLNSTLCNYADDNNQFSCEETFDQVINNLQTNFRTLKVWLHHKFLVLNSKKCHIRTLGNRSNLCNFACDDKIIKHRLSKKLLGLSDYHKYISSFSKFII